MKILVFGATGTIGSETLEQLLEMGHLVSAFVRVPAKISIKAKNLHIIQGDVLDSTSVNAAVPGHDAVVIALGAGMKGQVRTTGTANIIAAMRQTDTRRLICLSTLGVGDSKANLNLFWKYVMFGGLLRAAYADHVTQEELVKQSGLDWTIVRPGAYIDGERTGVYKHGFPASEKRLDLKISRADVADFILRQLTDETYLGKTPGLSY